MLEPLFSSLPLKVREISLLKKDVYKIEAEEGTFILKKINKPLNKMKFVWGAVNYLPTHGFSALPALISVNGSDIPLAWQGDIYFISRFLEGERADFSKIEDLQAAFSCLADFHAAAHGLTLTGAKQSYFNKQAELKSMVCNLHSWEALAKKTGGEFATLYIKLLPIYLARAETAFALLEKACYNEQAAKAEAAKTFIHGDVAARNFIIREGKGALIDFDYSRYDLHQADTARLLERSLGFWYYDAAVFHECLAAYTERLFLSREEMVLIIAFLSFPRRFWRLGKRYFIDGIKNKSLFKLKKLQAVLPEESALLDYLQAKYT